MKHGYTNETWHVDDLVVKRYRGPDMLERADREAAALEWLSTHLPVPELVSHEGHQVATRFVQGRHGQDAIADDADTVLRRCGEVALSLHSLEPPPFLGTQRGRQVAVHGDFGPQNFLFNETLSEVLAVVDWEHIHLGEPVEDVAWTEWIVRHHHPDVASALGHMYDAYGRTPAWSERHAAMIATCESHRAVARSLPNADVLKLWDRRLLWTRRLEAPPGDP